MSFYFVHAGCSCSFRENDCEGLDSFEVEVFCTILDGARFMDCIISISSRRHTSRPFSSHLEVWDGFMNLEKSAVL